MCAGHSMLCRYECSDKVANRESGVPRLMRGARRGKPRRQIAGVLRGSGQASSRTPRRLWPYARDRATRCLGNRREVLRLRPARAYTARSQKRGTSLTMTNNCEGEEKDAGRMPFGFAQGKPALQELPGDGVQIAKTEIGRHRREIPGCASRRFAQNQRRGTLRSE